MRNFRTALRHPRRAASSFFRPALEPLETRTVPSATGESLALRELEGNDTRDSANDLGALGATALVRVAGAVDAGADVDWYRFTLGQATAVDLRVGGASAPVLGLYNRVGFDFEDSFARPGVRLLERGPNVARDLAAGTYFLAVSGAGNTNFHPLLADSGLGGAVGDYELSVSAVELGLDPQGTPMVLAREPAGGTTLDRAPLVLRVALSGPLHPDFVFAGENVRLSVILPDDPDGFEIDVPLASARFSLESNELQVIPLSPLGPGRYRLTLQGTADGFATPLRSLPIPELLFDPDACPDWGCDESLTFEVVGVEGNLDPSAPANDTAAGAVDLGDVVGAGSVRVSAAIGDDPAVFAGQDVDLYHFRVEGDGRHALTAEVFAGRIGSPLDAGLSLYRREGGVLALVAAVRDSRNDTPTEDGTGIPLFSDPVLFAGLTRGDYYLAVSSQDNSPDPSAGLFPGRDGIFDPEHSHSGEAVYGSGPYTLFVRLERDEAAPNVLAVTPADGDELDGSPTHLRVQFSEAVNLLPLARPSAGQAFPVFVSGPDGRRYETRLASFDAATNTATFLMLDALPDGMHTLRLSGALGLTDLAGNPLVGNTPDGEYAVTFRVRGEDRVAGGDALSWTFEGDELGAWSLGVLFPRDLERGAVVERSLTGEQDPVADAYRFEVLQAQNYLFTFDVPGMTVELVGPDGEPVPSQPRDEGDGVVAYLAPGVYELRVIDVTAGYRLRMSLGGAPDSPAPLTAGPAPAARLTVVGSSSAPVAPAPRVSLPGVLTGTGATIPAVSVSVSPSIPKTAAPVRVQPALPSGALLRLAVNPLRMGGTTVGGAAAPARVAIRGVEAAPAESARHFTVHTETTLWGGSNEASVEAASQRVTVAPAGLGRIVREALPALYRLVEEFVEWWRQLLVSPPTADASDFLCPADEPAAAECSVPTAEAVDGPESQGIPWAAGLAFAVPALRVPKRSRDRRASRSRPGPEESQT